jgi:L-iditol 2-dehydrogenase
MKALVLEAYGSFVFRDVETPSPGPRDVLIKVKACAICGSDVHGMDGSTGRRVPPLIMGHEAAGVIEEVGGEVAGFHRGDRVTFDSTLYCGECEYCKKGQVNLCNNRRVLGVSCAEYHKDGAFAEYVAVPSRVLFRLPDEVTFEQAAMTEPLSVAYHATEQARIREGIAVVTGCGNIGLLTAQVLRNRGFDRVVVTDVSNAKLEMAAELGFEHRVNSGERNVPEAVREMTGNRGADLSFDAVGTESSVMDSVQMLRKGGECVLVGNITPVVTVPLQEIVTKQLSLLGTCASSGEYPQCLSLIADGRVNVNALISRTVPLSEGGDWMQRLYDREPGLSKVVLIPD